MSVWSLITESNGFEDWRIQDLTLDDLVMLDGDARLEVANLDLDNLGPDTAVPLTANMTYSPAEGEPIPVSLTGNITYHSATQAIDVNDLAFDTPFGNGQCNLNVVPSQRTWPAAPAPAVHPLRRRGA